MVLRSIGGPLFNQEYLYDDNHSHSTAESGWYTAPDGLQWTLNNWQVGKYFCLDALDTEDAISRMVAWTIHDWKVAPVAMVYGSAHWIVVRGYTADKSPQSSVDTSYTLSSFDVNNPWPPTPQPGPPPPHTDAADQCGTGGTRGVADENIAYSEWQSTYMTGIPGGHWGGKFVAICDPSPPPGLPPRDRRSEPVFKSNPDRLLSPNEAAGRVVSAIREQGFHEHPTWAARIADAGPGSPALVQRLDRLDDYYWIVPLGEGERRCAVSIDARIGHYRQMISVPSGAHAGWVNPAELDKGEIHSSVLRALEAHPPELSEQLDGLIVRPEIMCVYPALVWRPCRESLSPFYPFRMVTVGDHRIFIRTFDGAIFTSLTTGELGI
jgi:hypothetical protein